MAGGSSSIRLLHVAAATASILAAAAAGTPAWAGDQLVFGAGYGDFIQNKFGAGDFRFEYRTSALGTTVLGQSVGGRLWSGVEVMTSGSVWAGGGVLAELQLGRFVLAPQFGVGGYSRGGGKDLGSALEFRTAVEFAYQFRDQSRAALSVSHTSNAGITRRNPGIEAITVNYQLPLASLFGAAPR